MVSLVGGLLSNTFWKAVGGDTHPGGRDSLSGDCPPSDYRRGQTMGGLRPTRPHFIKKPINNVHPDDRGSLCIKSSHFCDGLCHGRDDLKTQGFVGGVRYPKDAGDDWVVFDLTSEPTVPSDTGGKSTLALSSSVTYTTSAENSTVSPRIDERQPRIEFDLGCYNPSHFMTSFEGPKSSLTDGSKTTCSLSNQRSIPGIAKMLTCHVDQPKLPSSGSTECPVKLSTSTCSDNNIPRLATPGNCSRGEYEEAWSRQCVPSRQRSSSSTWCGSGRFCHACAMASPSNTKENMIETVTIGQGDGEASLLPPEPPPVGPKSNTVDCIKDNTAIATVEEASGQAGQSCSGGGGGVDSSKNKGDSAVPFVGYREDIRAYDIYQITPHVSTEAHYSRLPAALPALTDSDSDPDDARKRQGVRKRKRKIPCRREGEGGKRYREHGTDEEVRTVGLDDITVYTSPFLEDYTNRISILHRLSSNVETSSASPNVPPGNNGQRRVSFSPGTRVPQQEGPSNQHPTTTNKTSPSPSHTPPIPATNSTTSYSRQSSSNPPRKSEDDVTKGEDSMNDDDEDDDDDDDDDDEASTVVPDDFEDETDSDIEVLAQSESWVDLSNQPEESPDRVTPLPFGNGEEYIRLLREAQKESNHSSARVSLASSRRDTPRDSPHDSPKSPPNSPNTEMTTDPEEVALKGVYINYYNKEGDFIRVEKNTETDWIWDWSSRPDQTPPKEWRFSHPGKGVNRGASIRRVMVGKSSLFSRDVLYTLLITNVLSLLIGTGIGIWLSKRSSSGAIVTLPIN